MINEALLIKREVLVQRIGKNLLRKRFKSQKQNPYICFVIFIRENLTAKQMLFF